MTISIVCFIKLTSSNGYKSQKFVSLIDAPYFKKAFAPGASIRRNTVYIKSNGMIDCNCCHVLVHACFREI